MSKIEYVEVSAKTVELAVTVAMEELGVDDPDLVTVDVITEPSAGLLGLGGQAALVRVKKTGEPSTAQAGSLGPESVENEPENSAKPSVAVADTDTVEDQMSSEELVEQAKKWTNRP